MCQRRMRRDGVMSTVKIHYVLHIDNDDCRSMTMIRDVYNILHILRATPGGGDRREASDRSKETTWR